MKWGKLCIFLFIVAECALAVKSEFLQLSTHGREVSMDDLYQKIEGLAQKLEEISSLVETHRKQTRNLIRNSIQPVEEDLSNRINIGITESKSELGKLSEVFSSKINKVSFEVNNVKLSMASENKIFTNELNELNGFKVRSEENNNKIVSEFNKINNKCENNNNELVKYKSVLDELKRFKIQSEIFDTSVAETLTHLKQLNNKVNIKPQIINTNSQHRPIPVSTGPIGSTPRREFIDINQSYPRNCAELLKTGHTTSEIYTVYPVTRQGVSVFCDQDIEGGGWTVIQTRNYLASPRENFYRNWTDYSNGFGNLNSEFWLGLDNIHALTNQANTELRIYLEDGNGVHKIARYGSFSIGDSKARYLLNVGSYLDRYSDAGDSLSYHNGMKFSTFDQDNDIYGSHHCAQTRKGAWWYRNCAYSNLNGDSLIGRYLDKPKLVAYGIHWFGFRGWNHSMRKTIMMIRPH